MDPYAREVALEQRARARRALDEARAAAERLREARSRAERLLKAVDPASGPEARANLRVRMRQIESRMLATDELMRSAERGLAAPLGESGRDASATPSPSAPGRDPGASSDDDAPASSPLPEPSRTRRS